MSEAAVEITPIGGVGEFGKNSLVIRAGGEAIVVDTGIAFPDESLPGIDRIAPDFSSLRNGERLCGIFLTHGHEDHIGALSLLLEEAQAPVFATSFTAALAKRRLTETGRRAQWGSVEYGRSVAAGGFSVTFFPVSHSVPQSAALLIEVAGMRIFHTGDFKLDGDSPAGESTDLAAFAREGGACDLLLVDSTNAERPGACPSEREARSAIRSEIHASPGRVLLTTFSSHVARIGGAVEAARECGRRVALLGKSLSDVAEIAQRFGYLEFPTGLRVDAARVSALPRNKTLVLCAGSQGEPQSALYRLALGLNSELKILPGDRAIFSARAIPGREKAVSRVVDHLLRRGATICPSGTDPATVHVSGHAYREDLIETVRALAPRAVLPVHGERRALVHCAQAARDAGVAADRIFLADNGDSLFLRREGARFAPGAREAGAVFLDSSGGAEVEGEIVRERRLLGSEGLVVVVARLTARGPVRVEAISRGIAASPAEFSSAAAQEVSAALARGTAEERMDSEWVRCEIAASVKRLCRRKYGARPMIVPVVAEG